MVELCELGRHRLVARLFSAVLVQLFQKIVAPFLGRRFIALVLHLKHDGHDLGAQLVRVTKNVVALATGAGVVVFFKMRALHKPNYDFNDDLVPLGGTYWVELARQWLAAPRGRAR